MTPDDQPHPLTRMVSIKDPVFWIFITVCVVLFTYDKFIGIDHHGGDTTYSAYGDAVLGAAFVALFLTIIADSSKVPSTSRLLNICCYAFEAASVLVLGVLIFR